MSLIHNLFGNAAEVSQEKIAAEFAPILIDGEKVIKALKLFRDLAVITNLRLIVVDKQGVTGSKQALVSVPWKSVKKFEVETAGLLEGDGELKIWVAGESTPMKWEVSRGVDLRELYRFVSYQVLSH